MYETAATAENLYGRYRSTAPAAVLSDLPTGRDGTIATLKHMRDFVRASLREPSQVIRQKALEILALAGVPPRKYMREMAALHAFVRDQIIYRKDPVGLELVQAPQRTLEIGYGDCDDKSTLLGALMMATGHPSRITALGFNGGPFSHVLVETKFTPPGRAPREGRWIAAETIIDKPLGWFPSGVTSKYSLNL